MNLVAITDLAAAVQPNPPHGTSAEPGPTPRSEQDFYQQYEWCLNAYPTVADAVRYLQQELAKLRACTRSSKTPAWQTSEIVTNIYLLSCGLVGTMEDYFQGDSYHLPRRLGLIPFSRSAFQLVEKTRQWRLRRECRLTRAWKAKWDTALTDFLVLMTAEEVADLPLLQAGQRLDSLLPPPLPAALAQQRLNAPSVYRRHDLTHHDVFALGRRFTAHCEDRHQPLLIVGLRTSGSFLAPLLQAFLKRAGYVNVELVTLRPKQGLSGAEKACLHRGSSQGYQALLVDDPPASGETVVMAVNLLRAAGFTAQRIVALLPIHPQTADWQKGLASISAAEITTLSLSHADWRKAQQLEPPRIEGTLREYFHEQGYRAVQVVPDAQADTLNAQLNQGIATARGTRLKRVYAVSLLDGQGQTTVRYVLAKSVGWGWLGYHAFLAGRRLARFVPPLLGLRDGFLFTEWLLPQSPENFGREEWIETAAAYVAVRTAALPLPAELPADLVSEDRNRGVAMLTTVLRGAYGGKRLGYLYARRIQARLAAISCPAPTLIDGRMHAAEWIQANGAIHKTDFEHHGLGKAELNVTDPAYDLAQFTLSLGLTEAEENHLVARYVAQSGDEQMPARFFLNKLLAGIAARNASIDGLNNPLQAGQQEIFHRQFVAAWNFLTLQTVRQCGRYCGKPAALQWRAPLVVLDIDGVLDRRLFGYPSTTAAGLEALSLLHGHGFTLAMNSARSCLEVQEYCRAFGLAGGLAEYGSWAWDAVAGRARLLVTEESAAQMERLREALAQVPGVFVNATYQHSIRANTYEDGQPIPIAALTMQRLLADLKLDRLRFHQTNIDTTVVAAEVDKGTGLTSLLNWVGLAAADTTAVGDSPPDLPMFRVAGRSFAPAQIGCAREAKSLGCQIADQPYQRGLLAIARQLAHPNGKRCPRCDEFQRQWPRGELFFDLLQTADQKSWPLLLRGMLHPSVFRVFLKS